MASLTESANPPNHYITEPLRSFTPEKLDNGDLRMAIACAGQRAYSIWGDEATLTEEFLSRDYKTWEGGLVSINHENNHDWVKATIHDIEYDSKKKLVICSFSGIPDWLSTLIYSDDYQGLSQECIPIEFRKNSCDVVKGYGTGVTIVTAPYTPAASPDMGVGIRPILAAILASKYPTEDTMTKENGGGDPAISLEAYNSAVSKNAQLESTIKVLETDNKKLSDELASWKQKYSDLESGEVTRTKIEVESAIKKHDAELKATAERESLVTELKSYMGEEGTAEYLATNPSIETIRASIKREQAISTQIVVDRSKQVGSNANYIPPEEKTKVCVSRRWDSIKSEWIEEWE